MKVEIITREEAINALTKIIKISTDFQLEDILNHVVKDATYMIGTKMKEDN